MRTHIVEITSVDISKNRWASVAIVSTQLVVYIMFPTPEEVAHFTDTAPVATFTDMDEF